MKNAPTTVPPARFFLTDGNLHNYMVQSYSIHLLRPIVTGALKRTAYLLTVYVVNTKCSLFPHRTVALLFCVLGRAYTVEQSKSLNITTFCTQRSLDLTNAVIRITELVGS